MSKTAITIDRAKETITVSRAFQIAAGNIGSAEHQEYLRMKEQYPGYRIEVRQKSGKKGTSFFSWVSSSSCSIHFQKTTMLLFSPFFTLPPAS